MSAIKDNVKEMMDTAADRGKCATESGENSMERMKQCVGGVMHSASEYAGEAKETVKHLATEAECKTMQAAEKIEKMAGEAYEMTAHAASDFGKEVTSIVRKHPIPSILVGFGVGMLVGRVTRF